MSYTALALLGVAAAVILDLAVLRTRLLRSRAFWTAYAIIVFFQLLTNGWLTARDIVSYDEDAILGTRLAFAPVEDLLFGFSLVVHALAWWVWWGRRLSVPDRLSVPERPGGPERPAPRRVRRPATGSGSAP